jgi:L-rhamnose mutarotase
MTLDLKDDPETRAKYIEYHRAVWPDVLDGLRGVGITGMKIYLHGPRLFMYMEAEDDFVPDRDFSKYMETGRAREWDELMRTFQQPVPDASPGDWWSEMDEVFDLDW